MSSGVRRKLVRALPFAVLAMAERVFHCRRHAKLVLLGLGQAIGCACAPMTPEALIQAEQRAYQQAEREAEFFRDARACVEFGGFIVIERRGRASRRDELRRVPGDRDAWFCRM